MKSRHQVSRTAIGLIKPFEGYRRNAARLADGRWTIGYGHTLTARKGAEVSEPDAEALLLYDLLAVGGAVNDLTFTPLSQNQFDALACFAFNIGSQAFATSNVLRLVNEGELLQAAYALEAWRKAAFDGDEIVVDSLIRRRAAEKALFLTPDRGFVPAPTAIVTPRLDHDAVFAGAVVLVSPMEGEAAVAVREPPPPAPAQEVQGAQDDLPMDFVAAVMGPVAATTAPAPEPEPEIEHAASQPARQGVLKEVLYEIPGYGTAKEFDPTPAPWSNLSLFQLLVIGAAGVGLLALSFVLAMQGAAAIGGGKLGFYGLGAAVGLAGAVCAFSAIYLVLNRLDRQA